MDSNQHTAGAIRVLELGRQMFMNEATRGDDNTLWDTMGACIRGLTRRFASRSGGDDRPMEATVAELHNIWFMFTLAASNIDADHPAQDRLTRTILWARETGVLTATKGAATEAITTSDGRIWVDLPFLVDDVRTAWEKAMISTEDGAAAKARNLAAGIARLAGLGLRNDAFTACGLDIIERSLEKEPSGPFTPLQLLAMVEVWLRYAGDKLFTLTSEHHTFGTRWDGTETGASVTEAEDDDARINVLTRARVLTWDRRLLELKSNDDADVSAAAERCRHMMQWCCLCLYGKGIEPWVEDEIPEP
ncbi:hypothetical protein PFICI_00954 [Pestalotiopsis fici W106-1]|uniref:Uncharacterized protein n=1 Tax=Pestalotiopsis fici (strain W106-1 / CGMCC3.15140) TaxID=1229662 RepID=W3XPE0_PESFW|nr:uncharacterized protein PFICI_00954 [Pestalotiopsis fici W106-1]ETS87126.1 hypothetical protein PFICI_00954 [Pestalotiopsis fici W106-1]